MSPVIEKPNNLIERLHTSQILVGLDVGFKTIGIAVSDRSLTIATPINTVNRKGIRKDLLQIKDFLSDYDIGGFVIGLPLSLDGNENNRTIKVRDFAKYLEKIIKTVFYDERFSTDVIYKELRKNSISSSKIKKKIDHLAASYILQGFLDNAKNN